MPCYSFECKKCQLVYDELTRWDESGKYPDVSCPQCGSAKKEKLISACNFNFAQVQGTDRWNSDSTGHDYRFKSKQDGTRLERAAAEKKSHMGSGDEIYKKIDDLNTDRNWDFSKI